MRAASTTQLPIVEGFMSYLLDERHFSPYTSRCYGVDLRQYAEFLSEELNISANRQQEIDAFSRAADDGDTGAAAKPDVVARLTPATLTEAILKMDVAGIRKFLDRLSQQHYSPATMARKIATLRSFHRWLEKRSLIEANPMLMIRTPKQAKRLPKAIDVEQVEKLLSAPDHTTLLGARDRAILETLYSTGIRVSELVGINRADIDDTGAALLVRGKGRRERIVPLGSHALAALRHYASILDNESSGNGQNDTDAPHAGRAGSQHQPPHAPPQLRHPPARQRSGPAIGAGASGTSIPLDDTGLHTPDQPADARRLRRCPSPRGGFVTSPGRLRIGGRAGR